MKHLHVKISDSALEAMCHAALETYLYGSGNETRGSGVEVNGHLWGHKRHSRDETVFFVDRISSSFSSDKHQNWVQPEERVALLQIDFMERWAPETQFLGDFHSHPYSSLKTVQINTGYQFSPGDFIFLLHNDFLWEHTDNLPLELVITICKLDRVHPKSEAEWPSLNIWRWDVGQFRFWLNAVIGYIENGARRHTGNTYSKVELDLNTRFFNLSGDRLRTQAK